MIAAGGGYPSAVVTRAHSSRAAVTKPAPAGPAATSPARARVSTAIAAAAAKPENFAHISATMWSLTVLGTPPASKAARIASHRAERSPVSSPNEVCPLPVARHQDVALRRPHHRKQRHVAEHPDSAETIAQKGDVVYPVQHRQYRAAGAQRRGKIIDRGVEVVGLAGEEHDVVAAVDGAVAHGLDRRSELALRPLDDEPPFGELRRPPLAYQKGDIGAALYQHAAVIAAERSRADDQKPHDSLLVSLSRASCRNAEMAWFLHAGASSSGEREGLTVEEADESVSGQGGDAEHQMT